jgi:hypothetical protein
MRLEAVTPEVIAPRIARAAGGDLVEILEEIRQGNAEGLCINGGEAWMVTRIERTAQGRELVVMCLEGAGLDQLAPQIADLGRRLKVNSLRAHSARPGMGRMLARHGWQEVERVYRVVL